MSRLEQPFCVALDVPDLDRARRLLDAVGDRVRVFKIGLELFCAGGPAAVALVKERGAEVFLDMKVNDIPKTAAGAVVSAKRLGVSYLTVHSNGGRAMVRASVDAAGNEVNILVVSVVTSLDDADLRDAGSARTVSEQVDWAASLASEEGAPGLVLAAGEVARVRADHPDLFLVTPGIRPAGADAQDQRRVGTPAAAIAAGSDMLVLARVVADAPDPARALEDIVREISDARVRA